MRFYEDDTITAISTPIGEGGIGIVRISGVKALNIAEQMFRNRKYSKVEIKELKSHYVYYGFVADPINEEILDETMMTLMKKPNSYTKEDIVEYSCHGGILSLKRVLNAVILCGARIANPGEFTKRAFLNGRIDLSQAEAVIDLIQAKTGKSLKSSIIQLEGGLKKKINVLRKKVLRITSEIEAPMDFPDQDIKELKYEEIERRIKKILIGIEKLIDTLNYGRILKEGIKTVIVGKTNVGKSSLFNALIKEDRAIVASLPGTTRDIIEELISIKGIAFKIIDTAGLKNPENIVEKISITKMKKFLNQADLVLALFDVNTPLSEEDIEVINEINKAIDKKKKVIVIENKIDLKENIERRKAFDLLNIKKTIRISLKQRTGLKELKEKLSDSVLNGLVIPENGVLINNLRQVEALRGAKRGLENVIEGIKKKITHDFLTIDLKDVLDCLGEITGDTVTNEIVNDIFSRFCIGK
ncbi:MAG: tRNA uridine-5-carboxymethylaminomethyl(34) synthesis GTPase MnmE [Candidatus Caldatribacteriota bacterium]|nr:tRNA uridine-5-carboxymethylaminomethyl(34) synthesis GTPase MnmE [Candidatus Caldatribacteriota bacterium]